MIACIRTEPTLLFIIFINVKHLHYSIALLDNSSLQKNPDDETMQISLKHKLGETNSIQSQR